jgi:hypothetical protein
MKMLRVQNNRAHYPGPAVYTHGKSAAGSQRCKTVNVLRLASVVCHASGFATPGIGGKGSQIGTGTRQMNCGNFPTDKDGRTYHVGTKV